jgi:transposase
LDVHKKTVAVALAESEKRSEVRAYGEIANAPEALRKLTSKLASPTEVLLRSRTLQLKAAYTCSM